MKFQTPTVGSLLVSASLFLCAGVLAAEVDVRYFPPLPNGILRVARPTIVWEIEPASSRPVTRVDLSINGAKVPEATYDPQRQAVVYEPPVPFAPGQYDVDCRVLMGRDWPLEKSWSFTVASDAVVSLPTPTEAQRTAWMAANNLRAGLRLPYLTLDPRLCASAQSHADYLTRNKASGHAQTPGLPGFTGAMPWDRNAAFGFGGGGSYEDVSYGIPDAGTAVRALFHAPYHRIPFLQPGSPEFGGGQNGKNIALEFGMARPQNPAVVASPGDGQRDVPLEWDGRETPSPLRLHARPRNAGPVGYPIVMSRFVARSADRIRGVDQAILNDDSRGAAVPVFVNSPENDASLSSAVLLIPQKPLRPGTTYRVVVRSRAADGTALSNTWSFTTRSE